MDVVLRHIGQIVIDHMRKAVNVKTAGGDISGNEVAPRRFEIRKCAVRADWLLFPWMATAFIPSLKSCVARRLAPCLVRVKTSTWRPIAFLYQVSQEFALAIMPHRMHHLSY